MEVNRIIELTSKDPHHTDNKEIFLICNQEWWLKTSRVGDGPNVSCLLYCKKNLVMPKELYPSHILKGKKFYSC